MTFDQSRRGFLQTAGVSAAAASLPLGASLRAQSQGGAGWSAPTAQERKRLVSMANFGAKKMASGKDGLAVSTHPLATAAAIDMLKMGGTAADAICAASLAQCVVEPHMTTLTGVFSMLYYEAKTGKYSYINGSANTPNSHPIFSEGLEGAAELLGKGPRSGKLCPIPGFWGGFEASHNKFGKLNRKTIMAPAIHYAREGFEVHPFLWGEMFVESAAIAVHPQGEEMYFRDGRLLAPGEKLVQSRHADTLERLAEEGSSYFYEGEWAANYVDAVTKAEGFVTREEMADYKVMYQEPVRGTYRDYGIIAAPAPDFGGQALVEIMNMAELIDVSKTGPAYQSPELTFKLMQIIGQVYTDAVMGRFNGAIPPVEKAISKTFAEERFANLSGPPKSPYAAFVEGGAPPPGSNHVTVIDGEGNVATVLHSIMSLPYTTKIFVDGVYACAGLIHLGSGIPGDDKRIHARICPNMFVKDGRPVLASGSPSVSLTENIVQTSMNILDFGMDIETAVHKPRFGGSSMQDLTELTIERDMGKATLDYLTKNGSSPEVQSPWTWSMGSFDGIVIAPDGTASACGDPRRTAAAFAV